MLVYPANYWIKMITIIENLRAKIVEIDWEMTLLYWTEATSALKFQSVFSIYLYLFE